MKKIVATSIFASLVLMSCGAVQSIVQNTFPYTTSVLVSTGVPADKEVSSTSTATNVQTWFGGNNNAQIKDVRISDAKISVTSPSGGSLSALKSIKIYISSDGTSEKLVASRSNISTTSSGLNLDLNNETGFLDSVVKSSGVTVRTVYELKNQTSSDMNLKVALNFSSVPVR
ncbi:hypothetical protein SAMN05421796_101709 [Chryseobacterium piscicola]|uniref:Lipoprotein n=2 Tax=Chryseobacterium TaxID=59732 RepID=A0A1N7KNR8_9FLAO|nr:hypothetical protein [Chryseobacterium piscicola]PQA90999.1 hypothetical protein B0A70_13250 [Chryseobacterium piscicola]SIS63207.1 hypothetical protein SAMN05421796_101709 [Chryseobacterium piscicola]